MECRTVLIDLERVLTLCFFLKRLIFVWNLVWEAAGVWACARSKRQTSIMIFALMLRVRFVERFLSWA
jgi:hypothetical protein